MYVDVYIVLNDDFESAKSLQLNNTNTN